MEKRGNIYIGMTKRKELEKSRMTKKEGKGK